MAHILIVDDETLLLDLISTTLRLDGHTVQAIADPLEALRFHQTEHVPVDLLVTDVTMKPISGFELVKRLTTLGFKSPVLFTSGYPTISAALSNSLGPRSIIEKPFTAMKLRKAVRRLLPKTTGASHLAA